MPALCEVRNLAVLRKTAVQTHLFSQDSTASLAPAVGAKKASTSDTSMCCPYAAEPGVDTDRSFDSSWSMFCWVRATVKARVKSESAAEVAVHPVGREANCSCKTARAGSACDSSAATRAMLENMVGVGILR